MQIEIGFYNVENGEGDVVQQFVWQVNGDLYQGDKQLGFVY